MHTDEAVNAYIVGQVLSGEPFTYDPQDRHGPALAALALPLSRLERAKTFSELTESDVRLTSVVAGTVTILLFGAAVEMFGLGPCLIAALLFAGASLPVYYDRYFIHEPLFVSATLGLILSGWRACGRGSVVAAIVAGACGAVMLASKETAILHFCALAGAGLVFRFWNLRPKGMSRWVRPKVAVAAMFTFLSLTIVLFTWFGRNWNALAVLLQGGRHFVARASGQGHQKPFLYYAQLLGGGWSGGLLLVLACLGFFLTLRKRDRSPFGFMAYYAVLVAAIYNLIPYKTPWLALNFWLPLALFAGLAVESLWRTAAKHLGLEAVIPTFAVACAFAAVLMLHDTRQRVFLHPADEANPYAYAHTSEDLLGLPAEIEQLARQNAIAGPRIAVIAADPWPLPWYLRHDPQVGFWQPGQQAGDADFYITSTDAAELYHDRLKNFRPEFFGIRPGVLILLWSPEPK